MGRPLWNPKTSENAANLFLQSGRASSAVSNSEVEASASRYSGGYAVLETEAIPEPLEMFSPNALQARENAPAISQAPPHENNDDSSDDEPTELEALASTLHMVAPQEQSTIILTVLSSCPRCHIRVPRGSGLCSSCTSNVSSYSPEIDIQQSINGPSPRSDEPSRGTGPPVEAGSDRLRVAANNRQTRFQTQNPSNISGRETIEPGLAESEGQRPLSLSNPLALTLTPPVRDHRIQCFMCGTRIPEDTRACDGCANTLRGLDPGSFRAMIDTFTTTASNVDTVNALSPLFSDRSVSDSALQGSLGPVNFARADDPELQLVNLLIPEPLTMARRSSEIREPEPSWPAGGGPHERPRLTRTVGTTSVIEPIIAGSEVEDLPVGLGSPIDEMDTLRELITARAARTDQRTQSRPHQNLSDIGRRLQVAVGPRASTPITDSLVYTSFNWLNSEYGATGAGRGERSWSSPSPDFLAAASRAQAFIERSNLILDVLDYEGRFNTFLSNPPYGEDELSREDIGQTHASQYSAARRVIMRRGGIVVSPDSSSVAGHASASVGDSHRCNGACSTCEKENKGLSPAWKFL